MPHVSSGGGDDLASSDEVKVYKDEGGEEKQSSENLSEDKLGLVTESEEGKGSEDGGPSSVPSSEPGKPPDPSLADRPGGFFPYLFSPYPYPNGATLPGGLSKVMQPPNPFSPLLDHFAQPPPAHMGIPPGIDPKTGLPRPPMYPIPPPPGQFPHPIYPTDLSQPWAGPGGYQIGAGFRSPYPSALPPNSMLARFSPTSFFHPHGMPNHGIPQPAIVTPGPKQDISHPPISSDNHRHTPNAALEHTALNGSFHDNALEEESRAKKKSHIKKPLNAFMLFMRDMRPQVMAETSIKESAAINQILGRKWHSLDRSEQAKYYEMARKEKELHMQLYPGWSARDNYATHAKKKTKKRRAESSPGDPKGLQDCNNPKKCRARFGVDQQSQWCKPCRRKKKCIRFLTGEDGDPDMSGTDDGDDHVCLGSVGTADSTTDADSDIGSPLSSSISKVDDHIQIPAVTQSDQAPTPTEPPTEAGQMQETNNNEVSGSSRTATALASSGDVVSSDSSGLSSTVMVS